MHNVWDAETLPRFWFRVIRQRLSLSNDTWPFVPGLMDRQLLDFMGNALALARNMGEPPESPTSTDDRELSPLPPSPEG